VIIADLIKLKPLRPVIQLGDQADEEEALNAFVYTEDLLALLKDFKERCHEGVGGGIFLKGHYGTGKSHLLSFLSQKSSEPGLQLKTSPISLIRYSSSESLEKITYQSIPLEKFESEDRNHYFDRYLEHCKQNNLKGFMVLYDELSEFLKSKESPSQLSEDIRFLQFLAEYCSHHHSWVIGAIQEDIEGIGHASRETSLKLKDRFTLRWNLSTLHVKDLLSQRLLQKQENSEPILEDLYWEFQKKWPICFKNLDTFKKIYPLHPGALDFLMGLGELFSEHRGALRFALDQLNTSNQAYLKNNYKCLILTDKIFDYFSERLQENLELKNYYQKVWKHLKARALDLIDEDDHDLSLRCLKTIILANLDARREGIELEELTGLCMFELGETPTLAQDYLKEAILDKLVGRVNYLMEDQKRYVIQLQHLEADLLEKLLEQKCADLDLKQLQAWNALMPIMTRRPIDFATFWKDPKALGQIQWLNTSRKISLSWTHENSSADLRIALPLQTPKTTKLHQLSLIPRTPTDKEKATLLRAASLLILSEQACPTHVEKEAKVEAQKRINLELKEWQLLLELLYREGHWYLGEKHLHLDLIWDHTGGFETNLQDPVYELFTARHPHFRTIAPKIEFYNERSLSDLIDGFVKVNKVSETQLKQNQLLELVIGLAKPLSLVTKEKQHYYFQYEPNHSPFLSEFRKQLTTHQGRLSETKAALSEGEYGLPSKLFYFLCWSLTEAGLFQAYRDKEPIATSKLSFHNLHTLTHIVETETLPSDILNQLLEHSFFREADHSLSSFSLQQHLWTFFLEQFKTLQHQLTFLLSSTESEVWSFTQATLNHISQQLKNLFHCSEIPTQESRQGLEALSQHLEDLEQVTRKSAWLKDFSSIYRKHQSHLPENYWYIADDFHECWTNSDDMNSLSDRRTSFLETYQSWSQQEEPFSQIEQWCEEILEWKKHYHQIYTTSHQNYYKPIYSEDKLTFINSLIQAGLDHPPIEPESCQQNLENELKHRPFCRCGHQPHIKAKAAEIIESEHLLTFINSVMDDSNLQNTISNAIHEENYREALRLWQSKNQSPDTDNTTVTLSMNHLKKRWQNKSMSPEELIRDFETWVRSQPKSQKYKIDE